MVVRAARAEEVGVLRELAATAPEAPHWGEAVLLEMVTGVGGAVRAGVLVAEVDGVVVGFGAARWVGVEGEPAEVESLVVGAAWRRTGIGSALLRRLVRWAEAAGAEAVMLEVRAGNAGALRLYEGMGFGRVGVRRGYYDAPREDAVVMRCGAGGGAHGTLE